MAHGAMLKVELDMMRTKFFEVGARAFARYRVLAVCGLVAVLLVGWMIPARAQEDGKATVEKIYRITPHTGEVRPVTEADRTQWANAVARGLILTVTGGNEGLGKGTGEGSFFEFNISFEDRIGSGFNDSLEGEDRRARLVETLEYIGETLGFNGTLDILVQESINDPFTGLLAFAGTFFDNSMPYTNGAAFNRLNTGVKPFPGFPEIFITFNFAQPWYSGTGETPDDQFDLVAVLLHEVTHGLGFLDLADSSGRSPFGPGGTLSVFDTFLIRGSDREHLFGGEPPEFLLPRSILTSNDVAFDGDGAYSGYDQGVPPPIYAPSPYQGGSSISHWDTFTIFEVLGSAVMTHLVMPGPADREYTPLDAGAMADIGYNVNIGPPRYRGDSLENFQALSSREENLDEGGLPILDTHGNVELGDPVVALTWENPTDAAGEPLTLIESVTVLRSVVGYSTEPTEETILVVGDASFDMYLDELGPDLPPGTDLWYTVIVDFGEAFRPQIAFARARSESVVEAPLVEAFGSASGQFVGEALSYSQLLFTPVGGAAGVLGDSSGVVAGASGYETTLLKDVRQLPVARNDANGNSFLVPMTDDGMVGYSMGAVPFPFFGKSYSVLYFAANGYVSFESVFQLDDLNFPTPLRPPVDGDTPLTTHFAIPRISYFFTDLGPNIGGEIWIRSMDDRVVITHIEVPTIGFFEFPKSNTVQAELFMSGHIRVTYQELSTESDVVVGLSAGSGTPIDPADLFDGIESVPGWIGLDEVVPGARERLSIAPIGAQFVSAGELVSFEAVTVGGNGDAGLTAEWDGIGAAPFLDNGDGTGSFHWQTGLTDGGTFTVRIKASSGDEEAYQDVKILIGFVPIVPVAENLRIVSEGVAAGATVIDVDGMLTAAYDYSNPLGTEEGRSFVTWFRNGQFVAGLASSLSVSATITQAGDQWHFRVIPVSADFEVGVETVSPTVTIDGSPRIDSVSPPGGSSLGGTTVLLSGARLGVPLSITFGGVEVQGIRAFADGSIEVVTPFFNATNEEGEGQLVAIEVVTAAGSGVREDAYRYVDVPIIFSVTPDTGPFAGRTKVVITGLLLTEASAVYFGENFGENVEGEPLANEAGTEITVLTPPLPDVRIDQTFPRDEPVTVDVEVFTPGGVAIEAEAFTYEAAKATDVNGDGKVDAVDVQIVINSVLAKRGEKLLFNADANRDGAVNASDVQLVINAALRR